MLEHAAALTALSPAIVHGFTDRRGGFSEGRFATLNLGDRWGDDPDAVRRNLEAVAAFAGFRPDQLVRVRQVHGADVLRACDVTESSQADALWCHRDDRPCVVGVMTADCVPVLLADREGEAVAAIHSGWRSTVANIVSQTVRALEDANIPIDRLVAAIGPCIELAAFEVGEEVAEQFDDAFVDRRRWPKPHVDLVAVVRAQLQEAGLAHSAIERVGACTHAHPDRYFSYRRDGAGIGQMMSFVGLVG